MNPDSRSTAPGGEAEILKVFRKLAAIEQARKPRQNAELLLKGLLAVPRKKRLLELRDPKYTRTDLLALLLKRSEEEQLPDPGLALELAGLAHQVALKTGLEGALTRSRAICLEINARRLLGAPGGHRKQDQAISQAAKHLEWHYKERARFCRTAALVRWEQGRDDEAVALFQHAVALFRESEEEDEMSTCATLLGLLLVELGTLADALPALRRGWVRLDWNRHPLMALRAGLAIVVCLAKGKQYEPAQALLEETRKQYSTSVPAGEMLRIYWREALALGALQQVDEAEQVLTSVVQRLLDEGSFAEAAVARVDLVGILTEAGRTVSPEHLVFELGSAAAAHPGLSRMLQVVHCWIQQLAAEAPPDLPEHVRILGADILRTFRRLGLWIKPLPFA